MENNQSAARAARRFLADRVRDDWDWPNSPGCWSCSDEEVRGVTEFRERYYGTTSEPESDPETSAAANPYQFDSPDSIGAAVCSRAESRRRKRRIGVESELKWNKGLACFVDRRDVWTGVASVRKYGTNRPPRDASDSDNAPTPNSGMASDASSSNPDGDDGRIPLAPKLLASNIIRQSITPRVYADIYDKVVVSSRTPTVPINLADMTHALVKGWKDNGEWPPKCGPLDPLAGRKKGAMAGVRLDAGHGPFLEHHPHVKRGVDSVRRIFQRNGHQEHVPVENNG